METKSQKFFVVETNCKLIIVAQKSKQTSQQKMISKIFNHLQHWIMEESCLKKYPTYGKQIIWQPNILGILFGQISVILDVDGTDGIQDARNIVKKLFFYLQHLKSVSNRILNVWLAQTVNANVVLKIMNVLNFLVQETIQFMENINVIV